MARHAAACALTPARAPGGLSFAVAGTADAPDIRRLLRENPIGGRFEMTLEREPDVFGGDFGLARAHRFILARDETDGTAIGLCERVVWNSYVDGEVCALPYLAALRVADSHRHRIAVLRGGFAALKTFAERRSELGFALTAITSDNRPAQRLLTAGLPGLPIYHRLEEFSTFALRPRPQGIADEIAPAAMTDLPSLAAFLRRENRRFQFSAVWTEESLRQLAELGLLPGHFLIFRSSGRIRGCLAVWDQRARRQAVIRRYPPLVRRLRPIINLAAPWAGLPQLPAPGAALQQAVLSHLAVEDDDPAILTALLAAALDQAKRRGFAVATVGFAASRPWREILRRRHRAIEYRTMLYLAHWPEAAPRVAALRPGIPHPELGLL
jgi:hypothetical protein